MMRSLTVVAAVGALLNQQNNNKKKSRIITMCSQSNESKEMIKVNILTLKDAMKKALVHDGFSSADTDIIADTILYAELRGNNQGIIKVVSKSLKSDPAARDVTVMKETAVSAQLDAGRRIGMVAVHRGVDIAIEKAKLSGVAVVGINNYASATGAIGYWARKIAQENLVGIVMCQCEEMVAPYGSYEV